MPELRADRTSIEPFIRLGNRAIIYQGWADPSTNAGPTIDYYAALARDNGGLERLAQSVRMFMVPGMYHCGGGPGPNQFGASGQQTWPGDPSRDMLWALINWVEGGGPAPQTITATRAAAEGAAAPATRKLCAFPMALSIAPNGPDQGQCREDPVLAAILHD